MDTDDKIFPWTDPREIRRIEEEQARIDTRRREIQDNALRLRDGRHVYVDGDRYRDGEGILLTGPDEAEAARQHELRPDAPAWAAQPDIDYGSAGYMGDYQLSSVPAFTAAAAPVPHETIRKLTDDDSGSQTTDIKKPPGPSGPGAPKFNV